MKLLLFEQIHYSAFKRLIDFFEVSDYDGWDLFESSTYYEGIFTKLKPFKEGYKKSFINLKFIATPCTGTDHIYRPEGVEILNLDDKVFLQEVYATAEFTFSLILSLIRKTHLASGNILTRYNNRYLYTGTELHGKTLGIIGYGRVGRQVREIAKGFSMYVVPHDKAESKFLGVDHLLEHSDIVTVHLPLDSSTVRYIGYNEFSKMKESAYFINTSRSEIVDYEALLFAIGRNKIAGAAVDVTESYPKHIIRQMQACKKILVTPHIAGNTEESREKTDNFIADKMITWYMSQNIS